MLVRDVRIPPSAAVWHAGFTPAGLGRSNELRAFVTIATAYVRSCDRLDPPAVANILYGTQGLGNCREARQLLAVVAPKIAACGDPFTVQQYSSAVYGLRSQTDIAEARLVLRALTPKLASVAAPLDHQAIINILDGCIGIASSAERDAFLSAFAERVRAGATRLEGAMLLRSLYGVECADTDVALRQLMAALATKAIAPPNPEQPPTLRDSAISWGTSREADALRASLISTAKTRRAARAGAWHEMFNAHAAQIEAELRARVPSRPSDLPARSSPSA